MRQSLFIIPILFIFLQQGSAQYITYENYEKLGWPDKTLYNLYGPVKSITHKNSSATGERGIIPFSDIGIIPFNEYQYDYTEFDSHGRVMVEGSVFKDEKLPSLVYTYNDEKMTLSIHHPSESNEYYLEHQYTGLSLIILEKHPGSPNNTITYKLTYSKDSLIKVIERLNSKNELFLLEEYNSNSNGYLVSRFTKIRGTSLNDRYEYIYDENNQLIEKSRYSLYVYESLAYHYKYQYDLYKNITSWEHKYHENDPVKYTFTYTYDDKGNWITRHLWVHGKIQVITERTIEYY